jgi:hypothetical protein
VVKRTWLIALLVTACSPRLPDRLFLIETPIVLAIRAEPAEAAPGASVSYHALVASAAGEIIEPLDWAFCVERAPLASLASVSPHCLAESGASIVPIGDDVSVMGTLPMNGCRVFGPEVPAMMQASDPPGRPADADPTGGYYQPLRVIGPTPPVTIERTRIACGLASGSGDDRTAFMRRYHANQNPMLSMIEIERADGTRVSIDPAMPVPIALRANERVTLHASWPDCGTSVDALSMNGCTGAEPYLLYDSVSLSLIEAREAMRLSWYATGGALDVDRTGVTNADTSTTWSNVWTAPAAGPASLWIVVRDDRGGTGWSRIDVVVVS